MKSAPTFHPGRQWRWRFGASLLATTLCGTLSLGTSNAPPCPVGHGLEARRALHFEPGEREVTLRVTSDATALILEPGQGLVLSESVPVEYPERPGTANDAGVPSPSPRYWLVCGTTGHEEFLERIDQIEETADARDEPPSEVAEYYEPYGFYEAFNIPILDLGAACEFSVTRSDTTDTLDTSISAQPVFPSACLPIPNYAVAVDVAESP